MMTGPDRLGIALFALSFPRSAPHCLSRDCPHATDESEVRKFVR